MTKFNKYIAIALIGAASLSACNGILDDPKPLTIISEDKALNTADALEAALVGTYDQLQSYFLHGAMFKIAGDMLSGNVVRTGKTALTFEETQITTRQLSNVNEITKNVWEHGYRVINRANNVIAAVPNVNDPKMATEKNRLLGEALFLRAITHFEMARYFSHPKTGLGIPIMLEPSRDFEGKPERAQASAVYDQVIKDLKEAEKLLPAANADFTRATSWAAKAYLARVYLHINDFQNARTYADDVIKNGPFSLNADVMAFAGAGDKESIFKLGSTQADNSNGGLNGSFNAVFSPKFGPSASFVAFATADASDKRGAAWYENEGGTWYLKKYNQAPATPFQNVPVIRLAEMLLTRAEALANLGLLEGAREDYNKVRLRAGLMADNATTSKDALLNAIFTERRKELAFEGDEFHNRKRLKRDIAGLAFDADQLVFPIAQRELLANPNLVQNPGY